MATKVLFGWYRILRYHPFCFLCQVKKNPWPFGPGIRIYTYINPYALQVTQPSSMVQTAPTTISSSALPPVATTGWIC